MLWTRWKAKSARVVFSTFMPAGQRQQMASDDDQYDEYDATVRVPKGTRLSRSRETDGAHRGLTRDPDTKKLGHAEIFLKDEADSLSNEYPSYLPVSEEPSVPRVSERSILDEVIAYVVSYAINVAAAEAKPHVRRLWNDKALPAIKSARNKTSDKIARARRVDRQAAAAELATFVEAAPGDSSEEVAAVLEEDKPGMSSEEAQKHLVAALMAKALSDEAKALSDEAKAFSDEQIRTLINARVEDVDGFLTWNSSLEKLTPQEVEDLIHLMLETNPSFLEEFIKMFWRDRNVDGHSIPVTNEKIKEALRLTDGEI
jgi:hypothetical protein